MIRVWRRTEEAITGLTRNQFTGIIPVRGFESLRLRFLDVSKNIRQDFYKIRNTISM